MAFHPPKPFDVLHTLYYNTDIKYTQDVIKFDKLTKKEYETMKFIWENDDGISFSELCQYAKLEIPSISVQTINTHLAHLIEKKFVKAEGIRRKRIYYPPVPRAEYDCLLARRIINELFDGSLIDFLLAYSNNEGFTEREILALKTLLRKSGE